MNQPNKRNASPPPLSTVWGAEVNRAKLYGPNSTTIHLAQKVQGCVHSSINNKSRGV